MFDFWIIVTACIIALNSSLLGSFLVLNKLSLIGDALSHAVLPGIVIAFLISGEINSFWMLLGASGFGIVAILLIDWLNRLGGFGKDSSIGIIYTLLFAIGIILITSKAKNADIDVDCVLFGDINTTPLVNKIIGIPAPTFNLIIISIITYLIVMFGLKGFKISSFDKNYAQTLGISIPFWSYLLLGLSSISTVYSFDSVGAIMVIGLLVIPPSFANIITRKLYLFLTISISFGVLSCISGHLIAILLDIPTVPTICVLMGSILILTLIVQSVNKRFTKSVEPLVE
ncbi:MAG: iron ABC transporter [Flavobacteriales bacterium]|nr:iron ABC transporter [Flavobacteriales bacterium]